MVLPPSPLVVQLSTQIQLIFKGVKGAPKLARPYFGLRKRRPQGQDGHVEQTDTLKINGHGKYNTKDGSRTFLVTETPPPDSDACFR